MDKQTISFRLDAKKVDALDTLAETLDRDRTYLLNEAVDAYLDVQRWQIEQIKEGLRQANSGKLVDHGQVKKQAARWRSR
jgi:RHH-type rel operon transcriptional repressor/antitoxin RelB